MKQSRLNKQIAQLTLVAGMAFSSSTFACSMGGDGGDPQSLQSLKMTFAVETANPDKGGDGTDPRKPGKGGDGTDPRKK